jgi:hypothetical protein
MDKLKAYKLDNAFSDGVVIYLDAAPDVEFLVKLPSQYNRDYSEALYSGLSMSVDDVGQVKAGASIMIARHVQEDAFCEYCLLSIDGEPVPDNFQRVYPDAVTELITKATELASAIEERVKDAVGKSSTSSSGKKTGQAKSDSMSSLSSAAG